jgi:hypothetical protein
MFLTRRIKKLIESQYRQYYLNKQTMSEEWLKCIEYIVAGYKRISQNNIYLDILIFRYKYQWGHQKIAVKLYATSSTVYDYVYKIIIDTLLLAVKKGLIDIPLKELEENKKNFRES